jgi:ABC-type taurine transport system substrate-binding protein
MKLEEILQLAKNKLNLLQEARNLAYMRGDIDEYYKIEPEVLEIEKIIEKLNT